MIFRDIAARIAVHADNAHLQGNLECAFASACSGKALADKAPYQFSLRQPLFRAKGAQSGFEFSVETNHQRHDIFPCEYNGEYGDFITMSDPTPAAN
ncbi:MAG: hypothetical protein EXR28_05530 [Betaproteobacteria bacterium]|nr:hypothetical protein [Betaproteobacteria bacterium]